MVILLTLFYALFSFCVIYPPTEFVSAGFTIPQLLDGYLGSENVNFIGYHMKRITITALIHSALPLGYTLSALWSGGDRWPWVPIMFGTAILPMLMLIKIIQWWDNNCINHPVVKALLPNMAPLTDWRILASNFNVEYRGVDKVSIQLNATSKFIATQTWLIKVTQYGIDLVKQNECALVATATDIYTLSTSGEDEVQYVNIEVIPALDTVKRFSIRISTTALLELQPRLEHPVRVPDHISLMQTVIERFLNIFKQVVNDNPVYFVDQELEMCIGCMQNTANVKLTKRCPPPPPGLGQNIPPCQQCNCSVLWCSGCIGRWWAARATGAPALWLHQRGSCPVCRATFCLHDVCPARLRHS